MAKHVDRGDRHEEAKILYFSQNDIPQTRNFCAPHTQQPTQTDTDTPADPCPDHALLYLQYFLTLFTL